MTYNTRNKYVGDGVNGTYAISFNYKSQSEVKVEKAVDGSSIPFTFLNSNTILITTPSALNGVEFYIYRLTDLATPKVTWTSGGGPTAENLNKMQDQLIRALQEANDKPTVAGPTGPVSTVPGPTGPAPQLRSNGGYIQYSTDLGVTWNNLVPLSAITGPGGTGSGDMLRSANLGDVANAGTARTNLGLGTAAVKATGTSGNTVPLLDGANTWSATQTFGTVATTSVSASGGAYYFGAGGSTGIIFTPVNGVFIFENSTATIGARMDFTVDGVLKLRNRGDTAYADLYVANFLQPASGYHNFGTLVGTTGYGLRDNAGVIEYKNSGGAWAPLMVGATLAEVRTGTSPNVAVTPKAIMDAQAEITLTDAATVAWDVSTGFNAKVTLGGNRTLGAPTNAIAGVTYSLRIIQDGTGSRTLAYNACWNFGAGGTPALTTTASKADLLTAYCVTGGGSPSFICSLAKGF